MPKTTTASKARPSWTASFTSGFIGHRSSIARRAIASPDTKRTPGVALYRGRKTPTATANPASNADKFAMVLPPDQVKKLHEVKLDARTMLLYSRALDAEDHKDKPKAVELLRQVVAKAPTFGPAIRPAIDET